MNAVNVSQVSESNTGCPTLPAALAFKEAQTRISISKIMTILLHNTVDGARSNGVKFLRTTRDKLKYEMNKLDESTQVSLAADILVYFIHISYEYGWIPKVIDGFMSILHLYPAAARFADQAGLFPLHHICSLKSMRFMNMDVFTNLLMAYPEGATVTARTSFGELTPLQMCLLSPQTNFDMISAIVRACPHSARIPFNDSFPIHMLLKDPLSSQCDDYESMLEAIQLVLEAHPAAAFSELKEQSVQLCFSSDDDRSPPSTPSTPSASDRDETDREEEGEDDEEIPEFDEEVMNRSPSNEDDRMPGAPQGSSATPIRLQISDSSSSSVGEDRSSPSSISVRLLLPSSSAEAQLPDGGRLITTIWSPFSRASVCTDINIRNIFQRHAFRMAKRALLSRTISMKKKAMY